MSELLQGQEPNPKCLVNFQPLLVRHFDLISQAPSGIDRLRELILTMAVQGKLVSQDPSDEPASELLKKIRAEKNRLIAEGKIKQDKPLAEITNREMPFGLPAGWSWCKGREIFNVIRGVTYQKTDARETPAVDYLPLLRANNIQAAINLDDLVYVPKNLVSDDKYLRRGDYLVCLASGSKKLVGKAAPFTQEIDCSFGAFCAVIRPVSDIDFLATYLSSPLYRDTVSAASAGIGINNLKGTSLLALDIPLPPLAEQYRIVTRVQELMQLCDDLEVSGQLEAQQHSQLLNTLLGALTQSETPEVLANNWRRIATHFDVLLDRPEAVNVLEQTILQLAVRGLLVPQDPNDEPASVLLQKISIEKDRLVAQKKIRKGKPLPEIVDEEKFFELPTTWAWVRLNSIGDWGAGATPSRTNSNYYGGKIPWFKSGELTADHITESEETVTEAALRECSLRLNQPGDVLIAMYGATIGKTAILGVEGTTNQAVCACTPFSGMSNSYLLLLMKALKSYFISQGAGGAQPNISREKIIHTVIGLPPLAEQSRIVTRVEELLAMCANLRAKLTEQQLTTSNLAEALIEGA